MSHKCNRDPFYAAQACAGKEPFTHERAAKVAKDMARRGRSGSDVSAYHCEVCGHWHVGSSRHGKNKGHSIKLIAPHGTGES